MKIKFFATRWGNTQNWDEFLQRVKHDGYDGVEVNIHADTTPEKLDGMWESARQQGLEMIAQHSKTYDADFNLHADNYARWFELVSAYPWTMINTQTGKDYFTFEQNRQLIDFTVDYSKKYNHKVVHETHRNKFSFAAHTTKVYLEKIPYLRLALDISHWVNVAESYLEDQQEAVDLAIAHADHLHARIGYTQGPQVPDPRAPEWQDALNHHLAWWDKLLALKKAEGAAEFTICPEFDTFPYLIPVPFTDKPICDQWEVNKFIKDMLQERYS